MQYLYKHYRPEHPKQKYDPSLYINPSIEMQAAIMSEDVYDPTPGEILPGGWHLSKKKIRDGMGGYLSNDDYNDPVTHLHSQLYERTNEQGKVEYAYVTRGTHNMYDVRTDLVQAFASSKQYAKSVENAIKISKSLASEGASLFFAGHSLGGAEAVADAKATGRPAIVFNPAALSEASVTDLHLDRTPKITAFIVNGEIVGSLQNVINLRREGKLIYLPAEYSFEKNPLNPFSWIGAAILNSPRKGINHEISTVIDLMIKNGY